MTSTDVLIIGAGPTGLMMASQLAIHRIPFRIIDKTEDHTTQSRALVIQARSVEILDQMGIAEKAIQNGKIVKAIGAFINGKKAVRLPVLDIGKGLTKFPHLLMLEQSHTERILVEFLREHGYEVERRSELVRLTQNNNEVISILKSHDGSEEIIHSNYLIGADGAHSVVRENLNIPFGGTTYQQSLFVLDCKADVDLPADELYLTFTDLALGGFFPLTNGRWRILGTIPPELKDKEEITFQDIEKNFASRVKMKVKLADPKWLSVYHSHHRYASTFRSKRCFLAGDAAHIHSPVGAQGMNTGLQDAYNLAWKLAIVLKGFASESILDTYTEERITIARNLVQTTDRIFSLLTSPQLILKNFRVYVLPVFMRTGGIVFQKQKWLQRFAFKKVSELGIHYRNNTLSQNASFGIFPKHAPQPGDRLPFVEFTDTLGNKTNIQEMMKGKLFCLLLFSESQPELLNSIVAKYKEIISIEMIPSMENTKKVYDAFGITANGYYVIRPDIYIACRSKEINLPFLGNYLSNIFTQIDGS